MILLTTIKPLLTIINQNYQTTGVLSTAQLSFHPPEDTASCCCTGATGATAPSGAAGVSTAAGGCGGASERFKVPFLAPCPRRKDIVSMEKWGKDGIDSILDDPKITIFWIFLNRFSWPSRSNANVSAPLPLIVFDHVSNLGGLRSLQQGQKQRPVAKKRSYADVSKLPDHRPSGLPRTVEALISIKAHQGENLWSLTNGLAQLLLECSMRSRWKLMARQRDVKERLVWMRRWSVRLFRLHVSPWIHQLIRDKYNHYQLESTSIINIYTN